MAYGYRRLPRLIFGYGGGYFFYLHVGVDAYIY